MGIRTDHMTWKCEKCKQVMHHYYDVGYDGPAAGPECMECHPGVAWKILCLDCAQEFLKKKTQPPGKEN